MPGQWPQWQLTGIINQIRAFLLERGLAVHPILNASLTDWVLVFTKPFLAFSPKIFGTEQWLTSQSERRELLLNQLSKRTPNEQHDHYLAASR
jgi:hypothetical protein